jgi:16S rRNA (uracil1498-N3)-methyltransferase
MPRFFVTDGTLTPTAAAVTLTGEDARHLSLSLRMAVGEEITLSDGQGNEYAARLSAMTREAVTAEILAVERSESELPFPIHLYMGYPKGDKLDTVIEKAVELGAATVTPFLSSRCVRRPAAEKGERLLERYNRIARGAAGQCGRALLTEVRPTLSFEGMLRAACESELALFCYEGEGTVPLGAALAAHRHPASVAVIVGSEGGFSPEEAAAARAAGCILTGLGRRILRCETAPLLALSCLGFFYDFGQTT